MTIDPLLQAHLKTGETTFCRCWAVTRADGTRYGFTDHDRDLVIDGLRHRADTGMTAGALQQSTGLSVDNAEAVGALSDLALTDADIEAGRFDGAEVEAWMVNWAMPSQKLLLFRGTLGEIRRVGGRFHAELRGLTEDLNAAVGNAYQNQCAAVLGDARCGLNMADPMYAVPAVVSKVTASKDFVFAGISGFSARWFERGRLRVQTGAAAGLVGVIRSDRRPGATREIGLWQAMAAPVETGDSVILEPGCDKRAATCRDKFNNFMQFRGFPHVPGEDWLMQYPASGQKLDGGKLVS